ncbi:MAG: LCP family protein [Clostridia bacterium]|nr:LCP family protein [Clostridia bacterium]
MNVRMFFKYFIITFLIACIPAAGSFYYLFSHESVGQEVSKDVVEALDEVEASHTRRNILLIGVDKSGALADVMMICSFSTKGEDMHLMSIQRDTWVTVNGKGRKINEVLQLGEDVLIQEVRETTGIPIHDYVRVNFKAVKTVVDTLGGVDFYVPQNMDYEDPEQDLYIHLQEGQQRLNGDKALQLLRFRSGYAMADIQRTKVQRDFMTAMFEQHAKIQNIGNVKAVYDAVEQYVASNVTYGDVLEYAGMAAGVEIQTFAMPYMEEELGSSGRVLVDDAKMKEIAETYFAEE